MKVRWSKEHKDITVVSPIGICDLPGNDCVDQIFMKRQNGYDEDSMDPDFVFYALLRQAKMHITNDLGDGTALDPVAVNHFSDLFGVHIKDLEEWTGYSKAYWMRFKNEKDPEKRLDGATSNTLVYFFEKCCDMELAVNTEKILNK